MLRNDLPPERLVHPRPSTAWQPYKHDIHTDNGPQEEYRDWTGAGTADHTAHRLQTQKPLLMSKPIEPRANLEHHLPNDGFPVHVQAEAELAWREPLPSLVICPSG